MLDLPDEIWKEIMNYLEPEEVNRLNFVNKDFYKLISKAQFDGFYMGFLNRLKEMDPSISSIAPQKNDPEYTNWIRTRFKKSFNKMADEQEKEIAHFKEKFNEGSSNDEIQKELDALNAWPGKATTIKELERRHSTLDRLNAAIIKESIDPSSNLLELSAKNITRFPNILFKDNSLSTYWQNLETLQCPLNKLTSLLLPVEKLPALKSLYVYENELTSLPIANFTTLTDMNCSDNKLTSLSIENCTSLEMLFCNNNEINSLSLENHPSLRVVDCSTNALTSISVNGCKNLSSFDCSYNQLTSLKAEGASALDPEYVDCTMNSLEALPRNLREHLGDVWYLKMLDNQRHNTASLPSTKPRSYG